MIYNSNSSLLFITLREFKYKHEILSILLPLFFLSPLFILQLLFMFSLLPLLLHSQSKSKGSNGNWTRVDGPNTRPDANDPTARIGKQGKGRMQIFKYAWATGESGT